MESGPLPVEKWSSNGTLSETGQVGWSSLAQISAATVESRFDLQERKRSSQAGQILFKDGSSGWLSSWSLLRAFCWRSGTEAPPGEKGSLWPGNHWLKGYHLGWRPSHVQTGPVLPWAPALCQWTERGFDVKWLQKYLEYFAPKKTA